MLLKHSVAIEYFGNSLWSSTSISDDCVVSVKSVVCYTVCRRFKHITQFIPVIASHTKLSPKVRSNVWNHPNTWRLIDLSIHFGLNKNVCRFCSRQPLLQGPTECMLSWFQFSVLCLISHSGISSSSTVCYCKAAVALSAVSVCVCARVSVCSRLGHVLVYSLPHISLLDYVNFFLCVCVLMLSVGVNLYLF